MSISRITALAALLITAPLIAAPVTAAAGPLDGGRGDTAEHFSSSTPRHEDIPTCRGVPATHVNEDGTADDDVIVVTDASVSINAWNGDDVICVSTGHGYGATVDAGNGDDSIITYSGENFIYGGADDDSIMSNAADHLLDGESGDDNIYIGQHPVAAVYGGDGNDRIFGSPFADTIHAGDDNDLVIGFGGNDTVQGGDGNDRLEGRAGADDLDGGPGSDTCVDQAAPATTFTSCEASVGVLFDGGLGFAT
ncbi:MAG: calcium-binding protein [Actinomycetota bacterium]